MVTNNFIKGVLPQKSGNYKVRYEGIESRDDFSIVNNMWMNVGECNKPEEVEWDPDSYIEL